MQIIQFYLAFKNTGSSFPLYFYEVSRLSQTEGRFFILYIWRSDEITQDTNRFTVNIGETKKYQFCTSRNCHNNYTVEPAQATTSKEQQSTKSNHL